MYSTKHIIENVKYVAKTLSKNPIFAVRLLKNYAAIPFSYNRHYLPLRFTDIAVTYACNMRCQHCSSTPLRKADTPYLSINEYATVAKKLKQAGLLVANFTGGDPFARPDFLDIVRVFDPKSLLVAVQTNGLAVTEEKLKELKKLNITSINVSIDSPDPATHDSFRNTDGAFERAINALDMAARMGFNTGVSYCLTHQNLYSKEREEIVKLAARYNAILNYNLAVPIGFWRGEYDAMITAEDRKYLLELLEANPRTKTDFETNYFTKGCGTIKEKLYVTAYGEVMPCPFIQVSFGNVLKDEINAIRDRAWQYTIFRSYWDSCPAAEDMDFITNTRCYSKEYNGPLPVWHENAFINREQMLLNEAVEIETMHRSCPQCGSGEFHAYAQGIDYEYHTCANSWNAVQCEKCGLVYLNPIPTSNTYAKIYPPEYKPYHFNTGKTNLIMRIRKCLDIFKASSFLELLPRNAKILDVGCGDGRYMRILQSVCQEWEIEGVEFSKDAADNCRKQGFTVREGVYENIPLLETTYDLIILNQVIEHVEEPRKILGKIRQELKPGGTLNIETPSLEGWDAKLFRMEKWGGYHFPRHLTFFNYSTLKQMLNAEGFEVLRVEYMLSPVFWVFSAHHALGSSFFSDRNPFTLGMATIIDTFQKVLRGKTSNMRVIARKM